jgi:hypothetical protein
MASCPPVSPQNPYKTTGKIIVPYIWIFQVLKTKTSTSTKFLQDLNVT